MGRMPMTIMLMAVIMVMSRMFILVMPLCFSKRAVMVMWNGLMGKHHQIGYQKAEKYEVFAAHRL